MTILKGTGQHFGANKRITLANLSTTIRDYNQRKYILL